jgi:hypothetical protein
MNINVMNLGNAIKKENQASQQDRAKAMIFFSSSSIWWIKKKKEYLTVKNLLTLWNSLKERFEY